MVLKRVADLVPPTLIAPIIFISVLSLRVGLPFASARERCLEATVKGLLFIACQAILTGVYSRDNILIITPTGTLHL